MKKYWYIPTGNKVWLKAAINLYQSNIATPILWVGDNRHFYEAKEYFGNAVYSNQDLVFYPERLHRIEYFSKDYDFFLSSDYIRTKDRCLKMMDRLDLYGNFSRLDREAIFNKLTLWILQKFDETNPNALIVVENPHSHTYYLMYEICLYKGIDIIKFNRWLNIPVLYAQNLRTGERQKVKLKMEPKLSRLFDLEIKKYIKDLISLKNSEEYILPAIKIQKRNIRFKNIIKKFIKSEIINQIKEFWFQFRKYFSSTYYPINPYKLGYLNRLWIRYMRKRNLFRSFNKFKEEANLSRKFVYFALSFEPERTTLPDGNEFHDQIIALLVLRRFIPYEYRIYVKEHPSQFYLSDKGSRGRSPLFYDCIRNIDGLTLLKEDINSLDLIRKAQFTASISGSCAYESAILGKKALVFGDTWYEGCPNIIKWNNNLKFNEFINSEISNPDKISEFIIKQKNLFCVPGCQNIVVQDCFPKFLNDVFEEQELIGVSHILKEFLLKIN